jgi:hypothetical protein
MSSLKWTPFVKQFIVLLIKTCLKYLLFIQVPCLLFRLAFLHSCHMKFQESVFFAPFTATGHKETPTTRKHITEVITMTRSYEVSSHHNTALFTRANIMDDN